MFEGILIDKDDAGYRAGITSIDEAGLPAGNVDVRVSYSTLNYKDALAITGKSPVVRHFPMVPGIDLVDVIEAGTHEDHRPGDVVLLNGWGVGEQHWGGLAQKARLNGDWLIPLPDGMSPKQSMAIGTAGYTAMLSIMALERHGMTPASGDVLVTGANGGVGSFAITLLSRLGYRVVASTGRLQEADFPERARGSRSDCSGVAVGTTQAIAKRTLGRSDRFRWKPYAGKRLRGHPSRWRGCRLWSRTRHGLSLDRRAVHLSRGKPAWYQQRYPPQIRTR